MKNFGFSLVEVLVVITIIAILLSIGTLDFARFTRKGAIESQTKQLYTDLMVTRSAAITQQTAKRVLIEPTAFTYISSALGSGMSSTRTVKTNSRPVTWAGKSASDTLQEIRFDERGTFNIDVANGNTTICVNDTDDSAQYDSVVVYSTRIHIGKLNSGANCASTNVKIQ